MKTQYIKRDNGNTASRQKAMNTPKTQREAVDLHRLVRHLRGRDRHYNASELMTEAADALESLIADKERLDALETVSCWIGIEDDGCHAKTKWSAGGVYIHSVREVADSYLPNTPAQEGKRLS